MKSKAFTLIELLVVLVIIFVLAGLMTVSVRGIKESNSVEVSIVQSQIVAEKVMAVEQRQNIDFFATDSFAERSTTVYYLISNSGDVAEVTLATYAKAKVGKPTLAEWKTE